MEIVLKKGDLFVFIVGKGISWMVVFKWDKWFYFFFIFGLFYFLIFKYLLMWGVLIVFKDYLLYFGFWKSEWVGFDYFKDFFMNLDFFWFLCNIFMFVSLDFLFVFLVFFILVLFLNEVRKVVYKRCI